MAELLERLLNTQDRLRPYIERYRVLMLADPSLPLAVSARCSRTNGADVNYVIFRNV